MTHGNSFAEQLERLFEACFDELRAMPDEDVLAGEPPQAVLKRASDRLNKAAAEAGRRRLAAAKQQRARAQATVLASAAQGVSAAEARAYIIRVANDHRYTLAARGLNEMSDEEALRLFAQIRALEEQGSSSGS